MALRRVLGTLAIVTGMVACAPASSPDVVSDASSDSSTTPDSAAMPNPDVSVGTDDASVEPEAGTETDAGTGTDAPVLLSVQVVTHGTMALRWRNPTAGCGMIEIQRKMNMGAYARVQTVTGMATAIQDMPGHANGTYCYQVICQRSGAALTSNERCATQ
ncbi:MAG: hypothetical protein Q8Q09_16075 [Deltaproteobacteria bacterium]|nr:hypothetical protein [Deltaproteobacteria bacterium]